MKEKDFQLVGSNIKEKQNNKKKKRDFPIFPLFVAKISFVYIEVFILF